MASLSVQNLELVNFLFGYDYDSTPQSTDKRTVYSDILSRYIDEKFSLNTDTSILVKKKLYQHFVPTYCKKMKNSFHQQTRFLTENGNWLEKHFSYSFSAKKRKISKKFSECSESTKRRRLEQVFEEIPPAEILDACKSKVKRTEQNLFSDEITLNEEDSSQSVEPLRFTSAEALALLIDAKLSKFQYNLIRSKRRSVRYYRTINN